MAPHLDPHAGQPVLRYGPLPREARLTAILVHGRGDSAEGILGLAEALDVRDVAYLAPEAAGRTWYPYSFLAPTVQNQPYLSSALRVMNRLVDSLGEEGVRPERVMFIGFSQGACLSLEYVARHARKYAGVVGLSGGLIGPPGTPRACHGSLDGTPVFLGCSDIDAHIPLERVQESAEVLRRMGAVVDERIYPGMGHSISADELAAVSALLTSDTSR
ncbi:MAG TPA: dienelactone hydrolase family protein [Vicinamibacterales bacterium]